jgi:hypothetical protein
MTPCIHLRGACYLLLLVVIYAIPFALAQRNATKQSVAKPTTVIVVTNTNDSGSGSLRDALAIANDGDTIDFDPSINGQTITLTSGQLVVGKSVTISGPGANQLAVDGNANDRIFYINPGETVIISGLTIINGHAVGNGGGILTADAALTVTNCTLSGNSSGAEAGGGGIFNGAGGIANTRLQASAPLTIVNCTISGNSSGSSGGGGILNVAILGSVTLTVTNSTLSGNSAGTNGGGISDGASPMGISTVTISNSTISGNSAGSGGGLNGGDFRGDFTISNSTISGNSVTTNGGGIENIGNLIMTNSTISNNTAANHGGGIYNDLGGAAQIEDTVLNAGASGGTIFNNSGTVSSLGYNLASDDGGGVLTGPGDQINTDPMLGPLQDNGGPTFTHALLPSSPAINAGDPNFTPPPVNDQRGFPRVANGRIDKGSFEVQRPASTPRPRPTPAPRP